MSEAVVATRCCKDDWVMGGRSCHHRGVTCRLLAMFAIVVVPVVVVVSVLLVGGNVPARICARSSR